MLYSNDPLEFENINPQIHVHIKPVLLLQCWVVISTACGAQTHTQTFAVAEINPERRITSDIYWPLSANRNCQRCYWASHEAPRTEATTRVNRASRCRKWAVYSNWCQKRDILHENSSSFLPVPACPGCDDITDVLMSTYKLCIYLIRFALNIHRHIYLTWVDTHITIWN